MVRTCKYPPKFYALYQSPIKKGVGRQRFATLTKLFTYYSSIKHHCWFVISLEVTDRDCSKNFSLSLILHVHDFDKIANRRNYQ